MVERPVRIGFLSITWLRNAQPWNRAATLVPMLSHGYFNTTKHLN